MVARGADGTIRHGNSGSFPIADHRVATGRGRGHAHRRERRLRTRARLRAYRQVGTVGVVALVAAGSFTTADATGLVDAWFGSDEAITDALPAVTAAAVEVDVDTVTVTESIAPATIEQPDHVARAGTRTVVQAGVPGSQLVTYTVTKVDGKETARVPGVTVVVTPAVDEIVAVGQLTIPPATDVEKGSNRELGMTMAADQYGWTGDEWACLDNLWQRESGWSHTSQNLGSGAYGIPQALPGSKMAAFGADWATNPAVQISWGLSYVSGRYGTPCGAWSAFQSKGWY